MDNTVEMDNPTELSDEKEVNVGLADVMHKILKTSKPRKKKTIVLAKAKKLSAKQVIETVKEEKDLLPNNKMKPCDWIVKGRMRPNPLDRNYEKRLLKITISGVVNLFNAVNQCKIKNGKSDTLVKKDFKLIDKNKFLGLLMNGTTTSSNENVEHNDNEIEMDVVEKKNDVTWDVLKKDFGNDTKWKNWDKTISNKN